MSSKSATLFVVFVVACIAFCIASVFGAMTGEINILPNNQTDSIDNNTDNESVSDYNSKDHSSYSSDSGSSYSKESKSNSYQSSGSHSSYSQGSASNGESTHTNQKSSDKSVVNET